MMLVFFGQLCFGAKQLSLTSDEPAHIANGYAILTTGDLWSVPTHGHPPLINLWNVWPLLLQQERPVVSALPGWHDDFIVFTRSLWGAFGSLDRLAYVTRYPTMLLALLLTALVARWTRESRSPLASSFALLLMTFDPTMVAHAQLDTTDLGYALFAFAAFYLCWKLRRRFSYVTLVAIGVASGAAMGAKASGILIPPLVCALFALYALGEMVPRWRLVAHNGADWPTTVRHLFSPAAKWAAFSLLTLIPAAVTLWGAYSFGLSSHPLAVHAEMLRIFLAGKDRLAFANGMLRKGGWWWYFPYAFAIKAPIPQIVAYGVGITLMVVYPPRRRLVDLALWLFPGVYLITALASGVNIGYRHLLPMFPFLYVISGSIGEALFARTDKLRFVLLRLAAAALGIWYVAGTLAVYPFAIAYFNEAVGGAKNGYHYLVDSNVDWGQSYKQLKTYMTQNAIPQVSISYSTWVDPGAYGIAYTPLFPGPGTEPTFPRRYDPPPGFYAISATTLQGIALKEHDPDLYEWFRHRKPQAQPGYGLLVYDVEPHTPAATWIAQCTTPVSPLGDAAIQEGFGRSDLRKIAFDCTQAWIYPDAGRGSGWYALYHDTWTGASPFTQAYLAPAKLSYQQPYFNVVPAFALFEWQGGTVPATSTSASTAAIAAPIDWPPSQVEASGEALTLPADLGDALTLVGYHVSQDRKNNVIELWTTWRVRGITARPLSLIGHLVQEDGRPVVVSDGLGVPPDQWEVGDLIVQRHRFEMPDALPQGTYWLQTGAYWLDTLERLPVAGSTLGSDRLLLTSVEVAR